MICPNCRQDAPTISRGLRVYCTACGAPRSLLNTETPVNVAGQPGKVGGAVASVLGGMVVIGGVLLALIVGAVLQAILPAGIAGYIVGGALGGVSLLVGLGLLFGGRKLRQTGDDRERVAREAVVFSLSARHGGSVTPAELARALSIAEGEADALLTEMVKRQDGRVSLEVDNDGTLRYVVRDFAAADGGRGRSRIRVGDRVPGVAGRVSADVDALAEAEAEAEGPGGSARYRSRA